MTVDVSVYGNDFTDSQIEIWYYTEPTVKGINKDSTPRNLEEPILIDTDFHWDKNDFNRFNKYGNITCRFTQGDHVVITQGKMERDPLGTVNPETGDLPTKIMCPSPKMSRNGKATLDVSVNGQDYFGGIGFEFTDALDLYRLTP